MKSSMLEGLLLCLGIVLVSLVASFISYRIARSRGISFERWFKYYRWYSPFWRQYYEEEIEPELDAADFYRHEAETLRKMLDEEMAKNRRLRKQDAPPELKYEKPLSEYGNVCPHCGLKYYAKCSKCVRCGATFAKRQIDENARRIHEKNPSSR